MLQALIRTITEILDSKKAAYSFIAVIGASALHLYFGVSVQEAILLVSPLSVLTLSQAHVDAAAAKQPKAPITSDTVPAADPVPVAAPVDDAAPTSAASAGSTDKTEG